MTVPLDSTGASGLSACWHSVNGTQGGVLGTVYVTDTSHVRLGNFGNKLDHLLFQCMYKHTRHLPGVQLIEPRIALEVGFTRFDHWKKEAGLLVTDV